MFQDWETTQRSMMQLEAILDALDRRFTEEQNRDKNEDGTTKDELWGDLPQRTAKI